MKVIDSSSLCKFVNREDGWEKIEAELEEGCVSVELALKELGNNLWKRIRNGELTKEQAIKTYSAFLHNLPIKLSSQEEIYIDAMELAISHSITLYDAMFVQLAKRKGFGIVTSDEKQANVCRKLGIETIYLP